MEIRIKVGPKGIVARSNPHGKVFCCGIFRDTAKEQDILDVLAWVKKAMADAVKAQRKRA
jgi:hypothetical protein